MTACWRDEGHMEMGIREICLEVRCSPKGEHAGSLDRALLVLSSNMLVSPNSHFRLGEATVKDEEVNQHAVGRGQERQG